MGVRKPAAAGLHTPAERPSNVRPIRANSQPRRWLPRKRSRPFPHLRLPWRQCEFRRLVISNEAKRRGHGNERLPQVRMGHRRHRRGILVGWKSLHQRLHGRLGISRGRSFAVVRCWRKNLARRGRRKRCQAHQGRLRAAQFRRTREPPQAPRRPHPPPHPARPHPQERCLQALFRRHRVVKFHRSHPRHLGPRHPCPPRLVAAACRGVCQHPAREKLRRGGNQTHLPAQGQEPRDPRPSPPRPWRCGKRHHPSSVRPAAG